MFGKLADEIKCEVCGGDIEFSFGATTSDYATMIKVNRTNVFDTIDNIINKYMVYKCIRCNQVYRFTYKDIESKVRRKLTEIALSMMATNQLPDVSHISNSKFFVYCGKCNGIDGSGCCPKSVFNTCEIKRFPSNVF